MTQGVDSGWRRERFPVGAGLTQHALAGDFHRTLHRLRAHEPVSWVPALGGWLVTSHELVTEVLRDPGRFTVEDERFSTGRVVGPSMLSTDGARHRAHREPFEPMFRPAPVADAGAAVTASVDALIDRFAHARTAEMRNGFAAPLAVKVISDFLGLTSPEDEPGSRVEATMLDCYGTIVAAVSELTPGIEVPAASTDAVVELKDLVTEQLRARPDGSLAVLFGRSTSAREALHSDVAVILFGAIETSEAMTANAILHLFGQSGRMPSGGGLAPFCRRAVTESLRLEPAAAVVDRYATGRTALGGAMIDACDPVMVSLAGANRDPRVFDQPDRFDPDRANAARQLAFARGPHTCLGIHLATLQTALGLQRLIERLPTLTLDQSASTAPAGLIFRKPERVVAHW
jgi:cytochrome P450